MGPPRSSAPSSPRQSWTVCNPPRSASGSPRRAELFHGGTRTVILAEMVVRHTRKHMPTRRVALGDLYLPMTGPAHGAGLLAAVVAENIGWFDNEQLEELPRLLHDIARHGISVPRIALRHRLQTDVHGLDRSRHRLLEE